jgi:5'-nucleotidase
MNQRPYILICNDDGVHAPGIQYLIGIMEELGDIIVVAPDSPQSGMGHAITIDATIRINHILHSETKEIYSCSGTPVDCIKLAMNKLAKRTPDLVVSGINHGSNSSINVIYSGTMSAAMEGCIEGVPSIGFSLCNHSYDADFTASRKYIEKITRLVLEKGLPNATCLNVNIPAIPDNKIKGVKICRQAKAFWEEELDERLDPRGGKYFWLTGIFKNQDEGSDTDEWALYNDYISIVPIKVDFTAHEALDNLKTWDFNTHE